jgi:hypothetical protein
MTYRIDYPGSEWHGMRVSLVRFAPGLDRVVKVMGTKVLLRVSLWHLAGD